MKITDILVKEMTFQRRKVFKIAFTQSMYARGVYVKAFTGAGVSGGLTVEGDVIRISDKPGLGFDEFEM